MYYIKYYAKLNICILLVIPSYNLLTITIAILLYNKLNHLRNLRVRRFCVVIDKLIWLVASFWVKFRIIKLLVKWSSSFICSNVWWLSILGLFKRDISCIKCNVNALFKNIFKGLMIVRSSNNSSSLITANCVKKTSLNKVSVIYDVISSSFIASILEILFKNWLINLLIKIIINDNMIKNDNKLTF